MIRMRPSEARAAGAAEFQCAGGMWLWCGCNRGPDFSCLMELERFRRHIPLAGERLQVIWKSHSTPTDPGTPADMRLL